MDRVWLKFPETGGTNLFPADAVAAWKARGWVDCDPPAWIDPTRAHLADVVEPAVEPAPPPPAAEPIPKTSRRPAGDTTEKEQA